MLIDFSPVRNQEVKYREFSKQFTIEDLKTVTNSYIDMILDIIKDATDAQIAYVPDDAEADDPYAVEGEENIGWSLGHLVAHVTASSEEGAAFSSILARGVEYTDGPRPRYETPWREVDTKAKAVQRLEESRRIRLAYLDTWPDEPHLDNYRTISPRFIEKYGDLNAVASFLFGLSHEDGHLEQIRTVIQQAREAEIAV